MDRFEITSYTTNLLTGGITVRYRAGEDNAGEAVWRLNGKFVVPDGAIENPVTAKKLYDFAQASDVFPDGTVA